MAFYFCKQQTLCNFLPMKHLHTTENQMMYVVESLSCQNEANIQLPGRQVINNILNYARALEVLRKKNGETFFIVGN